MIMILVAGIGLSSLKWVDVDKANDISTVGNHRADNIYHRKLIVITALLRDRTR
jgi:hypothetical protein